MARVPVAKMIEPAGLWHAGSESGSGSQCLRTVGREKSG